jgi:hypothetical protein
MRIKAKKSHGHREVSWLECAGKCPGSVTDLFKAPWRERHHARNKEDVEKKREAAV